MKKRMVIVGAGAFGRVVHSWLEASPIFRERHQVSEIVFIDDGEPLIPVRAQIIGTILDYKPGSDDILLCAIGSPKARKRVTQILEQRGARFVTFIADQTTIGQNVQIGHGTVVCPGVVIQPDCEIGNHVHIGSNCAVGHDTFIGHCTSLSPMVNLMSSIFVGEKSFFGGSSTIIPGLKIADEVVVGAGSVVTRDVPEAVTVKGVPGKW